MQTLKQKLNEQLELRRKRAAEIRSKARARIVVDVWDRHARAWDRRIWWFRNVETTEVREAVGMFGTEAGSGHGAGDVRVEIIASGKVMP